MGLIEIEQLEKVYVLKLNRGIINALNLEIVEEFLRKLKNLKDDSDVFGIVVTSSNEKFFAIGLDIPELFVLSREEFTIFYKKYNQLCMELFSFPKPTIAAITGHAIAGGCILTLCCDYRFIAEGRKLMGLNEIKLGVPVPYLGDCILRQLIGLNNAREVTDIGDFYSPEELFRLGMVDKVLPHNQLLDEAIAQVKSISSSSLSSFKIIKQNRIEMVNNFLRKNLKEREELFIDSWYSEHTRKQLKEAMKKF